MLPIRDVFNTVLIIGTACIVCRAGLVCASVRRPSICLSQPGPQQQTASQQEILTDCCMVNTGSATSSLYVVAENRLVEVVN